MHRMIYLILGWIAVALGAIGVVLPVLPTTPFILLAAFLFGKGSPRARAWLIEHAHFGPLIEDWERSGAIAPKYKAIACGMMGVTFAASWYFGVKPFVLVIQAVSLGGAAWFVLSRPNGAPETGAGPGAAAASGASTPGTAASGTSTPGTSTPGAAASGTSTPGKDITSPGP